MLVNISLLIAVFFTQQLVSISSSKDKSRSQVADYNRNNKVGEESGAKDAEIDKSGVVKKVYGSIDDDMLTPEGNFEVTDDDVEYFFKDKLNAKLHDFDDLKTQIAVLDRHLRKHSVGVVEANIMLKDLDEQVIKPYEDELKAVKNKVMDADDWSSTTIVMINAILDKSEQFLEMSRDKVYKTLDNHVASEEHKNEHKHGDDHGHDRSADYADLLTEEDSVDLSSQDEELLVEYMDSDIEDLENIIKEKEHLEHHIVEHFNLEDVDADELKLKVAENVLESIDVIKLKSYEESLKLLKTQIIQSNGRVNSDLAQQVANTMQNAETLSRAFQKNIEIAVAFDHEFEKHEETMDFVEVKAPESTTETVVSEIPLKFTFDIAYPDEKVVFKAEDDDTNLVIEMKEEDDRDSATMKGERLKDNVDRDSEAIKAERLEDSIDTDPWMFGKVLSSPVSTVLVLLTFVLLVAMIATTANRIFYISRDNKGLTSDNGRSVSDKSALISKSTTSPQLEMVKEDAGWTSNNWGQSWAATPNRRRKQN